MYNYENHEKYNNIGFSRIETKNGQCKITIHMNVLSLNEQEIGTYIFYRHNEDIRCLHLGDMMVKNGIGDLRITTKTDNLMESGFSLNEMGGIVAYVSENKYFGTEWDDKPIVLNPLNLVSKRSDIIKKDSFDSSSHFSKKNELRAASQEEPRSVSYKKEEYKKISHGENEIDNNLELEENIKTESIIKSDKDEGIEDNNQDELIISDTISAQDANLQAGSNHDKEEPAENLGYGNVNAIDIRNPRTVIECLGDFKSCESEEENEEIHKEIQILKARIQQLSKLMKDWEEKQRQLKIHMSMQETMIQKQDILNAANNQAESVAQRIFKRFPKMSPFEDGEIIECVRIEPQDIGSFPMQAWILANNSFLLHGYYSYRHLIFAKKRRGKGYQYIIGVPGINHSREKFIAKMFGFELFKGIKNKEANEGEFGYWYLEVAL